ncbi:MAG: cytochrome c [Bacteroidota bacterium]|nr:cytochrome c [Bacteroidota bacterium]
MRYIYKLAVLLALSITLTSCFDKRNPNYQFFPNMYESVAYETYSESNAFRDGKEGQLPVKGSIPRGFKPYEYPDTTEGLELARTNLVSPLAEADYNADKAKELYTIYCAVCHGEKGDGKGILAQREKFQGVPSYSDRPITEGSIFHVVTYGLNAMGSHANQLSQEERWQVARYVMSLKK